MGVGVVAVVDVVEGTRGTRGAGGVVAAVKGVEVVEIGVEVGMVGGDSGMGRDSKWECWLWREIARFPDYSAGTRGRREDKAILDSRRS